MSEFGGLRKHKKIQHALVGVELGSVALAGAATVALPRYGGPNFPKGIIECIIFTLFFNVHTLQCKDMPGWGGELSPL